MFDAKNFIYSLAKYIPEKLEQLEKSNKMKRENVFKDLVVIYKNSQQNITMKNFIVALSLVKNLLLLSFTVISILERNKSYIPQNIVPFKKIKY